MTVMPYTLTVATDDARGLVVEALLAASAQRTRVARAAAGELGRDKRAGRDVRTAAVRVAMLLAEADQLEEVAGDLAEAPEVAQPQTRPLVLAPILGVNGEHGDPGVAGDGTSPEAQELAELAGLTPTDLDAVEDELGRLPEDDPGTTVDDVLLLAAKAANDDDQ